MDDVSRWVERGERGRGAAVDDEGVLEVVPKSVVHTEVEDAGDDPDAEREWSTGQLAGWDGGSCWTGHWPEDIFQIKNCRGGALKLVCPAPDVREAGCVLKVNWQCTTPHSPL
jgi:hypothetical protein